jgi:hypothetical protein
MIVTTTGRGYQSVQFADQAGNRGIAEQSSEIDPANPTLDQPGSSYLLLGRIDAPVTLSIEQVGELVEYLERWLDEGKFVQHNPEALGQNAAKEGAADRAGFPTKDLVACAADSC